MAGIDYTIPQQFKGIQVESPINAMAQAMQLRNLQESSEMNALRRREYQRAREEEEAVRNWFASGKKLDSPEALNELYVRAPSAAANIEKSMLERSKTAAEIGYKKAQTAGEDIKTQRERLDFTERALYKSTTPAAAISHINQAVTLGYLTPAAAEQMKASVPNDPNQFQSWRMNLLTHSLSAKDLLDRLESQQDLEYAAAVAKAVETYAPIPSREKFFGSQQKVAPTAASTAASTSSVSATTPVPTPDTTVVTRSADVAAPVTTPSIDAAPQPNIEPIVSGESFVDYKNKAILNNRGHIPDQDTYFAAQDRLARQASAVAAKTTVAPTTTTTAPPPAPGEDRALDTVELISGFKGIDPQAADLYKQALTMKNPDARAQLNKIADEIQKRSQLTGGFLNVLNAEELIDRLERQTQTPLVKRQIATLREAIRAENEGRGVKVTVPVNVSTEKKFGEAFAGKIADEDVKLKVAAEGAPDAAATANRVLNLLRSGQVITGSAANIKLQMAKLLKLGGGSDSEAIANTEVLISSLADTTLGAIRSSGLGSGQGFTDKDREFLERAKAGQITYDAKSLKDLAELAHKAAQATAEKWNKRVKAIPKSALEGTGISTEPIVVPAMQGTKSRAAPAMKNSKGWPLEVDKNGNRAYVSPDRKQFEEVK